MSSQDPDPRGLLHLLTLATQQERELFTQAMAARGYGDASTPGMRVLAVLRAGPASVQSLADATATTKQFTAREVKKLADAGYVGLKESADDRRVSLVSLKKRGEQLLAAAKEAKEEQDQLISARLGEQNMKTLRRLLAKLLDG